MKLQGKNLKKVYGTFKDAYSDVTEMSFTWKKGEKGRVKRIFNRIAEEKKVRDPDKIDKVVPIFEKYIKEKTMDWLGWRKRCRQNYLGFLDNKENVKLFVKALDFTNSKNGNDEVVKTQTNDQWDW